eukprot:SAG22_NODE_18023_length_294_cov_1.169231_2_plen_31_part_01
MEHTYREALLAASVSPPLSKGREKLKLQAPP